MYTKEFGVHPGDIGPCASGLWGALEFAVKACFTSMGVLVERQNLNKGEHVSKPIRNEILLIRCLCSMPPHAHRVYQIRCERATRG